MGAARSGKKVRQDNEGEPDETTAAGSPNREARREKGARNRIEAMKHPLRGRLLRLLVERGVQSPAELSRVVHEDVSKVSYHVKRLVKLECAELVEMRPVRGAVEHFYRATERHLIDTEEWEDLDPALAEELVCEFIQKILDDFVASHNAGIVGSDKDFHITRTPLQLDARGFQEGMAIFEKARLAMADVEARSAKRMAKSGEPTVPTSAGFALFKVPRNHFKDT